VEKVMLKKMKEKILNIVFCTLLLAALGIGAMSLMIFTVPYIIAILLLVVIAIIFGD
jgi:fatty acid desaturase